MSDKVLRYSPFRLIGLAAMIGVAALFLASVGLRAPQPGERVHIIVYLLGPNGMMVLVGLLAFCTLVLLFTLTNLVAVRIESDGLLLRTLFSTRRIAWRELESMAVAAYSVNGTEFEVLRVTRIAPQQKFEINLRLVRATRDAVEAFIDRVGEAQQQAISGRIARPQASPSDPQAASARPAGFGRKIVNR